MTAAGAEPCCQRCFRSGMYSGVCGSIFLTDHNTFPDTFLIILMPVNKPAECFILMKNTVVITEYPLGYFFAGQKTNLMPAGTNIKLKWRPELCHQSIINQDKLNSPTFST